MIVLFNTPHTNHEVKKMYSWEDKETFVELKLMALGILHEGYAH
jgi:hypothetical protein